MSTMEKPDTITGGCLCNSIRYNIKFPPNHDFHTSCSTCQCSQCRKQTGSLYLHVHKVPSSALTFTSDASFKTFSATPGYSRNFCGKCGSMISWKEDASDDVSIPVGTFDKEALKKFGTILTTAKRHLWCEDEIPGVTDNLQGKKYQLDSKQASL